MPTHVGSGLSPSSTELGRFIRTKRLRLKMSQKTLAEKANMTQAYISALEVGKRSTSKNFRDTYAKRLAIVLNCNLDELQKRAPTIPNVIPQTVLGKFIQSRRQALNLTIVEFANKLNLPLNKVIKFEEGIRKFIPRKQINDFATALSVDIKELRQFLRFSERGRISVSPLGTFIRKQRIKCRMSMSMVAKEMKVSKQYISQMELGVISINEERLKQFVEILEIDLNEINHILVSP